MTAEFDRCLRKVRDMPLMLVVGKGGRRFHVVHAELVQADYRYSRHPVCLDSDIDSWLAQQSIPEVHKERMYWGRTLMSCNKDRQEYPEKQIGLSTTFCGHTYAASPRQVLSHLCLDTGAFITLDTAEGVDSDYGLTLFDVHEERWISGAYGRSGFKVAGFPLI
jgi:serine/threonine protein phosphatase 1